MPPERINATGILWSALGAILLLIATVLFSHVTSDFHSGMQPWVHGEIQEQRREFEGHLSIVKTTQDEDVKALRATQTVILQELASIKTILQQQGK